MNRLPLPGCILLAACLVLAPRPSGADPVAVPVFTDDFATPALLAEKWKLSTPKAWKVEDGALIATGGVTSSAAPAALAVEGPLQVRCRVKALEFGNKGGWAGVIVRGIHFTLIPGGFWHVYRIPGQPRSLGGIKSTVAPEVNRWYEFRIVQRDDLYQWFVDNEKIAEFREPNPVENAVTPLALAMSGGPKMAYDDVVVEKLAEAGTVSPNFLRNASFENVPDVVPTYWKPHAISTLPPERFWRDWGVDPSTAVDGRQSLRMAGRKGENVGFFSHDNGMTVGQPCTFSVYLKADRPDLKVQLQTWEFLGKWSRQPPILVGTNWARYSFTLDSPSNNRVRVGANVMGEGVLWADAAQLELGTNASPFTLATIDAPAKDGAGADLPVPPPVTLAEAPAAPVLDGKLDDTAWTAEVKAWPLVLPGCKPPREKTEAMMVRSGDTLYIGMRCHDSQMASLKASVTNRDGSVFLDDCVEILLDTRRDRTTYYHLAVNALGTRFDSGPGRDLSWNGDWSAATSRDDKGWSVEIAIPLAALSPTPMTAEAWGVNLCRANHKAGEFSSAAVTASPNFHQPERYPELRWSAGAFQPFLVFPESLDLTLDPDGTVRIDGMVVNRSGQPCTVAVTGTVQGVAWRSGTLALPADGRTNFTVAGLSVPLAAGGEARIEGAVRDAGDGGRERHAFARLVPVTRVLDGELERSFYSMEEQARFLARIRLPGDKLAGATLSLAVDGKPAGRTWSGADLKGFMTLDIPVTNLPPGAHALALSLADAAGKSLAKLEATLEKRPASRALVPVDRTRRCLVVDDQPWLAVAPLVQLFSTMNAETTDRIVNHVADSGFRTLAVVGKVTEPWCDATWSRIFERCAARGVRIIAWPGFFHRQPKEEVRPFIEKWRRHPSLIAWLAVDEPELYATPEETKEAVEYVKSLDPDHPVYVNNTLMGIPSRFAGLPGDIISIDDYLTNREGRSVKEIVRQVEIMEAAARPTRRPVYMFVVGNNLHNHFREPTAPEQVAQSYGCAVAGASGLLYFMGDPAGKRHAQAVRQINHELLDLAPVLLSPEPAPAVTCSAPGIRFAARRSGSHVYIIAVNLEAQAADVKFAIPGVDRAEAAVLFEDRLAEVAGGTLAEAFEPHARHVYRIEMK